ncbi:MAG: universal stress protein [Methanolobus sp.]|nr:universal stress protein [Methanolobus sp.]
MQSEMYRKIMVAIDGSENANKAALSGIEIAKLAGAKLYALNVMPMTPHPSYFGVPIEPPKKVSKNEESLHEHFEKGGTKALDAVKEMGTQAGVEVETVLVSGHPGSEIIDFAETNDIDLIVMGTLGRTGLDRVILGSVATDVVRNANTRVLVVK